MRTQCLIIVAAGTGTVPVQYWYSTEVTHRLMSLSPTPQMLLVCSLPGYRYILPINEKKISFLSTEATDYPESNFSE